MSNGTSIPHLLRVHFSGVGHPDARLSPLTLNFNRVDAVGIPEPLDSVIWAENGVGKSSIRALLFSLLHPNIHEVMKSSQGPLDNRKYELFFGPRDAAFVVTEWILPDDGQRPLTGFPQERPTLVLGFTAHWPGNHRTTLRDLDRHFFMFKPRGPFTFDRLPIRGLAEGVEPINHSREFIDWFRELAREVDGRYTSVHKEWSSWLAEVGLDPMVFSYQLRMNGAQGGILGLFKHRINTATDFVHFFLETVLNQDVASDVVKVLDEKKTHVEKKSQWETETAFVEEAIPGLEALQKAQADFTEAETALRRDRERAGALIAGLAQSEKAFKDQLDAAKQRIKELDAAIAKDRERFLSYQDYRSWLRYHEAVLEYGHAETRLEHCRAVHQAARKRWQLLKAALEFRDWQAKLDECKAIEAELAARKRTNLDVETELRDAGTALAQVLDREIKAARVALEDARGELMNSRKTLVANQKAFNRVKSELGKVNEEIRGFNAQMQNREKVLHRLVQSRALAEKEAPSAALTLWKEKLREAVRATGESQRKQLELEDEKGVLQSKQHDRLIQITKIQAELEQLEITREVDRYTMEELASDADLRGLTGEGQVHLANPDLPGIIREQVARFQQEMYDLNRRLSDEKETLANIEQSKSRLYPPPGEVAKLLTLVREDLGIPAFWGAEALDESFADTPEEAEKWFTRDPARYLGIMVRTKDHLRRIDQLREKIEKAAYPVQVSLADGEPAQPPRDAVVLRPGHRAAFNRKAAEGMIAPLRQGIADKEKRIDAIHLHMKRLNATLSKLEKFLEMHPDGALTHHDEKLENKRTLLGILEIEQQGDQEKIRALEGEILAMGEKVKQAQQLHQRCENALSRLRDFMEDHEVHYKKLVENLNTARDRLHQLEDQSLRLEASLEEDHSLVAQQQETLFHRKTQLERKEEQLRGVQYQGGKLVDITRMTLTEAENTYRLCLDRFKKTSEKDETLRARLEEKQSMAAEREARFRQELGPHPESDIEGLLEETTLAERLREAEKQERQAAKDVGAAEEFLGTAREHMREAPTIAVDYQLPEGETVPETRKEARARKAAVAEKLEKWRQHIDRQKDQLADWRERMRRIHEDMSLRALKAREFTTHIADHPTAEPETLPDGNAQLETLLSEFWDRFHQHRQTFSKTKLAVENRCEKLKELALDPRFQDFPNDKREILKNRETLLRLTEDIIKEFHIFREVIQTSLRMSEESMEAVVTRLDANVSDALFLMNLAGNSSRLPENMEGWGGQSFLKIDIPGRIPERLEDRKPLYERVLREALESGKAIRGIDLVKRGIDALAGNKDYKVWVMKPSYALKQEYHPVTEVKGWSDGEKITTVILLYCAMVQLRAISTGGRPSQGVDRTLSNGMLFLDNPFGEANSLTFVKMQLSMARALNIQLVYTASGSHKHLMARFPRIIRLSQEALGASGKTFVKAMDVGQEVRAGVSVTAAHFGKRAS